MSKIEIIQGDCLDVMKTMDDNSVDCVITDPQYGIGEARGKNKSRSNLAVAKDYGNKNWDDKIPTLEYFNEMIRVSGQQIIFGGNYFAHLLPPSPSWIVWDKDNGKSDFADCELAWTSHKKAVRKIKWRWQGMLQEEMHSKDKRVHPTQKPIGVMFWIVKNYTNEGDTVLDPFMGSGTTGVACQRLNRNFIGIEISPEYCAIAKQRIAEDMPLFNTI